MKAVIQRVMSAVITIDYQEKREIGEGLLVFLGIMNGDSSKQADFLAQKICGLRIFNDERDKMNLSISDIGGDVLIVSNFTLSADCRKGYRPSFDRAAAPGDACVLYDYFVEKVKSHAPAKVCTGVFGAHMDIDAKNNGPVTIIIDTEAIGK